MHKIKFSLNQSIHIAFNQNIQQISHSKDDKKEELELNSLHFFFFFSFLNFSSSDSCCQSIDLECEEEKSLALRKIVYAA